MRDLFLPANEIQSFCQGRGWRFCFIRTGHRLAWETVETELEPLCEAKEAPHILPRLRALRGVR